MATGSKNVGGAPQVREGQPINRGGIMSRRASGSPEGRSLLRYGFGNLFRWVFIGLAFTLLISLIVALHEALSFQRHVRQLINDPERSRQVMVALQRIEESSHDAVSEGSLPFGAVAVRIDALMKATDALKGFTGFIDKPDDGGEGGAQMARTELAALEFEEGATDAVAVSTATAESAPPVENEIPVNQPASHKRATAEFHDLYNQLQLNLNDLRSLVVESTPEQRIVDKLDALRRIVTGLTRFSGGSEVVAPSNAVDRGRRGEPATEKPAASDQGAAVLEGVAAGGALEQNVDNLRQAVAVLEDELTVKQKTLHVAKIFQDLGQHADRLEGLKTDPGIRMIVSDPAAAGAVPVKLERGPGDYGQAVDALAATLSRLERALSAYNVDIRIAKDIASPVNALKLQADELGEFAKGPDFAFNQSGDRQVGAGAQARYEKTVGDLNGAIQEIESSLARYTDQIALADAIGADPDAQSKAQAILNEFRALGRFDPLLMPFEGPYAGWLEPLPDVGLNAKQLATLSNESLMLMFIFVVGAIGSLVHITKYYLKLALQGHRFSDRPERPWTWVLFRPVFGIVVALAVYLLVKAGQIAFSSEPSAASSPLNLPILSVVALFAGLLSWDALEAIENRGAAWFRAQTRRNLWATGLENALRAEGKSPAECANQVGRSVEQVERWLMSRDMITPEMQDRIVTWLGRRLDELFSQTRPQDAERQQPLWASGLEEALNSGEKRLDAKSLAELLGEDDVGRVRRWIDQELQVSPPMQWRIVSVLETSHGQLFDKRAQKRECWGVKLRAAMDHRGRNARALANEIGVGVKRLRGWIELDEPVPPGWQDPITAALGKPHGHLFSYKKLLPKQMLWAVNLRTRLQDLEMRCDELAEALDAEAERVHDWAELDEERGRVAPATRTRMAELLKTEPQRLFSDARPSADFTKLDRAALDAELKAAGQNLIGFAELVDLDLPRLREYRLGEKRVPPATQRRMAEVLDTTVGTLFPPTPNATEDAA
jgi:plasmid maintenance system antidote protein VapI